MNVLSLQARLVLPIGRIRQARGGELRCSADGDEQMELALAGADLGEVGLEEPDRIGLEFPCAWLVALDPGQAGDVVALHTAVQA